MEPNRVEGGGLGASFLVLEDLRSRAESAAALSRALRELASTLEETGLPNDVEFAWALRKVDPVQLFSLPDEHALALIARLRAVIVQVPKLRLL